MGGKERGVGRGTRGGEEEEGRGTIVEGWEIKFIVSGGFVSEAGGRVTIVGVIPEVGVVFLASSCSVCCWSVILGDKGGEVGGEDEGGAGESNIVGFERREGGGEGLREEILRGRRADGRREMR